MTVWRTLSSYWGSSVVLVLGYVVSSEFMISALKASMLIDCNFRYLIFCGMVRLWTDCWKLEADDTNRHTPLLRRGLGWWKKEKPRGVISARSAEVSFVVSQVSVMPGRSMPLLVTRSYRAGALSCIEWALTFQWSAIIIHGGDIKYIDFQLNFCSEGQSPCLPIEIYFPELVRKPVVTIHGKRVPIVHRYSDW